LKTAISKVYRKLHTFIYQKLHTLVIPARIKNNEIIAGLSFPPFQMHYFIWHNFGSYIILDKTEDFRSPFYTIFMNGVVVELET